MPPDRGSTRKPAPPDKDGTKKTTSVNSHSTRKEGTKSKGTTDDRHKRKEDQKAPVERTSKSRDSSSLRANDNRVPVQQKASLRKGDEVQVRKRNNDKSDRMSLDKRDIRNTTDVIKQKSSRDVNNDINKLKETFMKNKNAGKTAEKSSTTPRRPSDVSSTNSLSRKTTNLVKASSTSSSRHDSKSQQKPTTTHRQIDHRLQRNESIKSRSQVKESSSMSKKLLVANTTDSKELSARINTEPVASLTKVSERRSRRSAAEDIPHERSQPQKLSRDRTRTRTLSPREVKVVKDIDGFDKQKMKDEIEKFLNTPSTSSAVPLMPEIMIASKEEPNTENDDDYDYEDDFEDYESDFEECTDSDEDSESSSSESSSSDIIVHNNDAKHPSSQQQKPSAEEEKKMDSGNYDLAENQRKEKKIQELKMAVEQENATFAQKQKRPPLQRSEQVLEDEGFEDEKSEEIKNVNIKLKQSSINFESARKTRLQQQMQRRVRKRGEQLMKMIHFDVVSFGLLDLPPIPYDIYMRCYGKCNSVQAYVQTNEDNLTEETQTEEITMKNKWTQNPVSFHALRKGNDKADEMQLFSQECRGVGGDESEENADVWKSFITVDTVRLSRFLQSAGKAVLVLLEESLLQKNETWKNKTKLPFSDGFVSLNVDSVDCLKNMPVTLIRFPPGQATILLTVHQGKDQVSNLCVWSLLEPSKPFIVLSCPGIVSATCFDSRAHVVLAGLSDGTICLWDLKEDSAHHLSGKRSSTYNSVNFLRKEGHFHPVVAIESITHKVENDTVLRSEVSPAQICSLDVGGLIVIWTVIQNSQTGLLPAKSSQMDLGLAYWGRTRLVLSSVINIPGSMASLTLLKDAEYLSLGIDDKDHLYVGTTAGRIIHCLRSGMKPRPKMYLTSDDLCSHATCIDVCPFGEPFFLVGCSDGSMKLFWRNSEKEIAHTPSGKSPLVSIQWLCHTPCSIFSLDRTSRIQVWDLNVSDVSPVHSVCCEKTATSLRLSPRHINGKEIPTLVLAFEDGTVEVHQLRKEFWSHSQDDFREKINSFLRYTGVF